MHARPGTRTTHTHGNHHQVLCNGFWCCRTLEPLELALLWVLGRCCKTHTIKFQAWIDESVGSPIQSVIGAFLIQKMRYDDGRLNGMELAVQKPTLLCQLTGTMLQ